MKFQRMIPVWLVFVLGATPLTVPAQPRAALTGTNAACNSGPILTGGKPDTIGTTDEFPVDDSGFVKIFNGKNLKGWWEGCGSSHSDNDKTNGGIWLVDSVNGLLFANQNTNGAGSILMTNKSYGNYELIVDFWPSFGDDGGIFNRVTASGSCYQTTMDYIGASSVGGVYFEGGYTGTTRNIDPFVFGANRATITIGTNSNANNRLDTITKRFGNPLEYGCPATGCGPANWTAIFDTGGWNQMRVQFFGSGASASNKVHNFAWIRKLGSTKWVPTIRDSVQFNTPAAPLGLQIHGTIAQWGNHKGNWYRNIRIRPLRDDGTPILPVTGIDQNEKNSRRNSQSGVGASFAGELHLVDGRISGRLPEDFEIRIQDVTGRELERIEGRAGDFQYAIKTRAQGILIVSARSREGRLLALTQNVSGL